MQYTYTVYNTDDFQFVTAISIWLFIIYYDFIVQVEQGIDSGQCVERKEIGCT